MITHDDTEEIWNSENTEREEVIWFNEKYVGETAKRVCDYINSHEDLVQITTFCEYRCVVNKEMSVIKEAHNVERKEDRQDQPRNVMMCR